jgi:hypothetical protein
MARIGVREGPDSAPSAKTEVFYRALQGALTEGGAWGRHRVVQALQYAIFAETSVLWTQFRGCELRFK